MRLIIVDGLDGVGKDTHANLIKKKYEKKGENVVIRSHPTSDNFFGRKAKNALLGKGKFNKIIASVFYMFDVLRSIKKYYNKKGIDTLIMVRYLIGTAYLPEKLVNFGYNFFENFVPISENMFFLDASPEEILKRVEKRDEKELFETHEELIKVRKKALNLVKNWIIIDTSNSIKTTFNKIDYKLDLFDEKT
jgi:dTMP kinase